MSDLDHVKFDDLEKEIHHVQEKLLLLKKEMHKVIIGQETLLDCFLLALICHGHILLEGVPGLAKTLAITTLSEIIDLSFKRIQFTPDLLPSDITGSLIYDPTTHQFTVKKGPLFAHLVLIDEINRAPAKVQSALLEAMAEHQVTIGDSTYKLPSPFFVLATQNPLEQQGTYPLPEAQLDRFMFKVNLSYPTLIQEKEVLRKHSKTRFSFGLEKIPFFYFERARQLLDHIFMDEKVENYIVNLVCATRNPENFQLNHLKNLLSIPASPRSTLALVFASKAHALLKGRSYVVPGDVQQVAYSVLNHRLFLSYEALMQNISKTQIIEDFLSSIPQP